jgi:hypothetical protein
MNITFTPAVPPVPPKNTFVFSFEYEHGDFDQVTHNKASFPISKAELPLLLDKIQTIIDAIENSRSTGTELPHDFEELATYRNEPIPVELDSYAKMHMSNYFAAMDWTNISYYDSNGDKFIVNVSP